MKKFTVAKMNNAKIKNEIKMLQSVQIGIIAVEQTETTTTFILAEVATGKNLEFIKMMFDLVAEEVETVEEVRNELVDNGYKFNIYKETVNGLELVKPYNHYGYAKRAMAKFREQHKATMLLISNIKDEYFQVGDVITTYTYSK